MARLERRVSAQAGAAKRAARRSAEREAEPAHREIDPGDAVPPGVAVLEPEPMDEEAEQAKENLEERLSGSKAAVDSDRTTK